MPSLSLGNLPQSQLDQLPITSSTGAGTVIPGLGGGTKYWSSNALGLGAFNFAADSNGFIVKVSSFIDVTGCRTFCLLFRRTNAGVGIGLSPITVFMQYRMTTAENPPTSLGASQSVNECAASAVNTAAITFPPSQAAGETQTRLVAWDLTTVVGQAGVAGMIGSDVRLWLNIGSGADPGVANVFSCTLWGAS